MGKGSKIEWLAVPGTMPATWNPIRARNLETDKIGWFCTPKSHGCDNCYAASFNIARGNGIDYLPSLAPKVEIFLDDRFLRMPLDWGKPHTIFPCSMTDLFGEFVSDEWLDMIFAVMAIRKDHTFITTTKQPDRMRAYIDSATTLGRIWARGVQMLGANGFVMSERLEQWPLKNLWAGVSVCDGGAIDHDFMRELEATPAHLKWVSYEPAIGWFDLKDYAHFVDWFVVGGESGSTRDFHLEWAYDNIAVCYDHNIPFFLKQLGRRPVYQGKPLKLASIKGSDMEEWPESLRGMRSFPV